MRLKDREEALEGEPLEYFRAERENTNIPIGGRVIKGLFRFGGFKIFLGLIEPPTLCQSEKGRSFCVMS